LTKQFNLLSTNGCWSNKCYTLLFCIAGGTLANPVNLNYYMTGLDGWWWWWCFKFMEDVDAQFNSNPHQCNISSTHHRHLKGLLQLLSLNLVGTTPEFAYTS
jgi:hypothetical protein